MFIHWCPNHPTACLAYVYTLQGSKPMFFLYFLIFNFEQNVHSLVWKQEKGRFSTETLAKAALIWTKNTLLSWATHKGTSDIIKIISRLTPQYSGTWMKWAVINGVKVHKLRNVFQTVLTQLHRSLILSAYLLSVNSRESLNECVVIQQSIWRKYLKKHRYSTENSTACLCHARPAYGSTERLWTISWIRLKPN